MSLATKIFLGFVALLLGFALLAYWSVVQIRSVGEDLYSLKVGHVALAQLLTQLDTHEQNRFRDLEQGLEQTDPASQLLAFQIANGYFPEATRSVLEQIRIVAEAQKEAPGHAEFYRRLITLTDQLEKQNEGVDQLSRSLLEGPRTPESLASAKERLKELEIALRSTIWQLHRVVSDATNLTMERSRRQEDETGLRILTWIGLALGLGALLTLLMARALAPIRRLVVYARAISRGDYAQTVGPVADAQLGFLADELTQMARARQEREAELDRQADELERAYRRVEDLKRYHESIVRSLRTAILVTDRELKVTSTNPAAQAMLGVSAEGLRGLGLQDLPLGQLLVQQLGELETLLARTAPTNLRAVPLSTLLVDVTVAPFESERGEHLGLVIALEDVTDAVHTKEALIRSERLAAIGRMSAHVTHEIRNPLSSIGINAELLADLSGQKELDSRSADEARTLSRAIVKEVDRLSAITDDYLRFARLPRPELVDVDLGELLRTIGAFVKPDLLAARVELELRVAEALPKLAVDPDQLRQALLNLVRNAKESMPEGGRVILGAEPGGDGVELYVRDSGVGIPEGHLDRIFDPFYSTKMTGTGLGLTLTQQIVGEHGGALKVQSTQGVGSEFRIHLPLRQALKTKGIFEPEGPTISPIG